MASRRDGANDRGVAVLVGADRVAVAEPERVRIFDGDRFDTTCEAATGKPQDRQFEERVDEVIEPIDPVTTERLPPLSTSAREDPAGHLGLRPRLRGSRLRRRDRRPFRPEANTAVR